MKTIYISGNKKRKKGGFRIFFWIFAPLFFILFFALAALKVTAPTILETYINRLGSEGKSFAFSIRDVKFSISKGEMTLNDVKVYNPETKADLVEAPQIVINFDWNDMIQKQHRFNVSADQVNLILSKDFHEEIERMKTTGTKKEFFLNEIDGKVKQLNVIEQKEDSSRTVISMKDVALKVKNLTPSDINDKTEFQVTSTLPEGGNIELKGKTQNEGSSTPWNIQGTLKAVPSSLIEKLAGEKLPFGFPENRVNAKIVAESDNGKVKGEIAPDIHKVQLLDTKNDGFQSPPIQRLLTENLAFTLPFTLEDNLKLEYQDTYKRLKTYRKGIQAPASPVSF